MTIRVRAGSSRSTDPWPQRLSGVIHGESIDARTAAVSFQDATVSETEIIGGTFTNYYDVRSSFDRCTFQRTKFRGGSFGTAREWEPQTVYRDCLFDGVRIGRGVAWYDVHFERCEFRDARIEGMISRQGEFIDCTFSGRLVDCDFEATSDRPPGAIRPTNEFRGNDFSRADLVGGSFLFGIDLDAQRFPADDDYLIIDHPYARAVAATRSVEGWPPSADRDAVLGWLGLFIWPPMVAQKKALFRRSEVLPSQPQLGEALLRAMLDVRLD